MSKFEKWCLMRPKRCFVPYFKENVNRVKQLANLLANGKRGIWLGQEILNQLNNGYLTQNTYDRLSRWVNPKKPEPFVQPIAMEISILLYGREIIRCT